MTSDKKPDYRVYKSRKGPLRWFSKLKTPAKKASAKKGETQEYRVVPEKPAEPAPYKKYRREGRGQKSKGHDPKRVKANGRQINWRRITLWVVVAIVAWLALSLVLFMVSAQITSSKITKADKAALTGSGNLLTSPNTVLVLGTDKRKDEPGRGRADTIMLLRFDGGKSSKLSIPRDTRVTIPGFGPSKINAAFALGGPALMVKTIEFNFTPVKVNHLLIANFSGFEKFVDSMGGVTMELDNCIHSEFEGKKVRLSKGKHHLSGEEALDVVRVRKNSCSAAENDLSRAGRQQLFINAVRSRMHSPFIFPRLPWVAWNAPKAVDSDMKGPGLLSLFLEVERTGETKPVILPVQPSAFGTELQVKDPQYKVAIERFLNPR